MTKIETVKGPISPEKLGITLPHEHLLVSVLEWAVKPAEASKLAFWDRPVTMDILGTLRRDPYICKDNLLLLDERLSAQELMEFKKWGGGSIVDVSVETRQGGGRDPLASRRISEVTGVNVLVATGWYWVNAHPAWVKDKSIDELADYMVAEIAEGIGDTGIKAGVIGEIGCNYPLHSEEEKVLRAAARAHVRTGAGLTVHPEIYDHVNKRKVEEAEKYLDILQSEGVNMDKFYLSHACHTCLNLEYHRRLLDRGATLSYDNFGMDYYSDSFWPGAGTPSDRQRVNAVVELCAQGYDKQLVLSHDLCAKYMLVKYGGFGYAHVVKNIVPELKFRGVSESQVRNMLVENPKRLLSF